MNEYENILRDAALAAVLAKGAELIDLTSGESGQQKVLDAVAKIAQEVFALKPTGEGVPF